MFASIARRIVDNGWPAPIPVVAKRPVVPGWEAFNQRAVGQTRLEGWCRRFPRASVGHPAGNGIVFVDQDIMDPSLSAVVDRIADDILGRTPAVRIGRAPKLLRVYQGSGIASRKAHPIEIFGDSGQAVLYGIHPDTGLLYYWTDEEPLSLSPSDLPLISAQQVETFLAAAAEAILVAEGSVRRQPGSTVVDFDLFRRLRTERSTRRGRQWLATLKRQLREATPGSLHNVLISVTGALVRCGFSDQRIRGLVARHFSAPRRGPYADVWGQVDDAIAGARRRWGCVRDDADFEARVLRGLGQ